MHVIGTAGHVDHGKSTLVRALTGMDPDRLREEKEREMTIDLGFAWITLDGEEVGIVDVPGHRDFIENMLAGVGGIDLALFVIASDEGVMPQTREHLAILDLLGVQRGIVALTKVDMVDDPDWLELVTLEAGEILKGTVMENAPIVPVSARTGTGVDALKSEIISSLHEISERPDWARPRLPIDRVFSLPGFGTVVTGTLIDGSFQVGDEVEVHPGGLAGRIRGLQTHKVKRDTAHPGSRVAINLSGLDRDELRRGQVVTKPGQMRSTLLLDAQYRQLPDADSSLSHNAEVKLFSGSAEVVARARTIGTDAIRPGDEGWIQLVLSEPIAIVRGDRFILRRPSPGATIGGGAILDPQPGRRHRRNRPDSVDRFHLLAQGTPEGLLLRNLTRMGPVKPKDLFETTGLSEEDGRLALQRLIVEEQAIHVGQLVLAGSTWQGLRAKVVEELSSYHAAAPLRKGIDREELRSRLRVPPPVFNSLCDVLISDETIFQEGTTIGLPHHVVRFSPEEEAAVARLMQMFALAGVQSPHPKECKAVVGEAVYFALVDQGRIVPVAEDVVYSAEVYDKLISTLSGHLHAKGSISAAEARDLLSTSRKYAIALLEHMDELRITRRDGDVRLPVKPLLS